MRRLFPILAVIAGLSLVSDLVARLVWSRGDLTWFAVVATLVVHASVFDYLRSSSRRVGTMARRQKLPDWVVAQTEKNRRKAWVGEVGGLPLVAIAALAGPGAGSLAVYAAAVAFQIGAFVVEFVVINAQARLVAEVEAWVKKPDVQWNEIG